MLKLTRLPLVLALLLLTSCSDPDLVTVSKALRDTAQAVSVYQSVVIDASAHNLLSENTARALMQVSAVVNERGQEAVAFTRHLSKLAPADRTTLLGILTPIEDALGHAGTNLLLEIRDPATRQKVQAALLLIRSGLSAAQLALALK